MRKKLLLFAFAIIFITILIISLFSWAKEAYAARPLLGKLTIAEPSLQTGIHLFQSGNFEIQVIATGQEKEGDGLTAPDSDRA